MADEVGFVAPGGGTPVKIMSVVQNKVRFNSNVEIYGDLFVDGSINGRKLAENTVTGVEVAFNPATVQLTGTTPARIHGLWLNVEKAGSPIDIDFNSWATMTHHAGGSFTAYVQLVRSRGETGGTVLMTVPIYGSGMANDTWQGPVPIKFVDKPGEGGNWHYYVQIYLNVNNMSVSSVTSRYGKLTEMKNNVFIVSNGTGSGAGSGSGGGGGTPPGDGGGGGGGDGPILEPNPGGPGGGGTDFPIIT